MDVEQLKSFCAVVEFLSFRKAAESLQITQPGVSRRIKGLEDELGIPLLQRGPQTVSLTPQGKRFLPYAERILKILTQGVTEALNEKHHDHLSIGSSPTISHNLLPEFIRRFKVHHDSIITLYTVPSSQVYEMLLDQTIDLGFASAFFPHAQLSHERIFSETIVCVGCPALVEAHVSHGNLVAHPLPAIINNLNTDPWRTINEYVSDNPRYKVVIQVDSTHIAREIAKIGIGIAFLPHSEAVNDLKTGTLVEIPLSDFELPHRPVYMITYKDRQLSASVTNFKEVVLAAIADKQLPWVERRERH
ncbi:MAG: LysR family transcriptional regulator [Alicyclobacillus herbarius]|uniref:LysR family transcriptional regulator n=1 Tax=Alicyclobacillus herbarius TaxID=122960 RepID=UPI0004078887|nr:LysR family transcriptional regulator [Alicyclobacillus herbarius]MCL6632465.1 LysR family transcriptional regulator [Alicyclobacillus herbarius]